MTAEILREVILPEHLKNNNKSIDNYVCFVTKELKFGLGLEVTAKLFLVDRKSFNELIKENKVKGLQHRAEIIYDLTDKKFIKNRYGILNLSKTTKKLYLND